MDKKLTEKEKNIEQLNIIHAIFSTYANDRWYDWWYEVKKLADLREEDALKVVFQLSKSLNEENIKLIELVKRGEKHDDTQSD